MKRIIFVSAILGTSFSGVMASEMPRKRDSLRLPLEDIVQSSGQKSPTKGSPRTIEIKRSPRQSLGEQGKPEEQPRLRGKSLSEQLKKRVSSSPIDIKTIERVQVQSNGSPVFINEENMYQVLGENQKK